MLRRAALLLLGCCVGGGFNALPFGPPPFPPALSLPTPQRRTGERKPGSAIGQWACQSGFGACCVVQILTARFEGEPRGNWRRGVAVEEVKKSWNKNNPEV